MSEILEEFVSHGQQCLIARTSLGVLVGYVAVPEGHPWEAAENEWDEPVCAAEVHGGVTWFRNHTPWSQPGSRKWAGFDTAHHGDYIPFASHHGPADKRWTEDEVKTECEKLARQIAEVARG